ncbi:hypothetical protein NC651_010202 [Populus alba x Populus x berolinensis]|nr:hypothetical protein NC651_010202 [Populus alba x Populus x berolinensis]
MATTLPAFFQKNADGTPISFLFKGTSPSSSTCKEEEDLLLVCMFLGLSACALFMDGISKGQRCTREMYKGREGEEKDRYRLPFFFSYAFLSLTSLTHIGRGSLLGGKSLQKQYGRGKKEACRIGVEKDAMGS